MITKDLRLYMGEVCGSSFSSRHLELLEKRNGSVERVLRKMLNGIFDASLTFTSAGVYYFNRLVKRMGVRNRAGEDFPSKMLGGAQRTRFV